MKSAFRLLRRAGVFYCVNTATGQRKSLRTRDRQEAAALVAAKTQAEAQPALNMRMARVYLSAADPGALSRTWRNVLACMIESKHGENRERWARMDRHLPFAPIWDKVLIQTTAEDLWSCLNSGTVTTNKFLRIIRNFAADLGWLPHPLIPARLWPAVRYGAKRSVTREEHNKIIGREPNQERRAFYQLAWYTGASQTDLANLTADRINWENRQIAFHRKKTNTPVQLFFGDETTKVLRSLPRTGPLFPYLRTLRASDRATEFSQRCAGLSIKGVTLHSYRYGWAERAQLNGYPERFAMLALGHNSRAVHRAYAKRAEVVLPSLEDYEKGQGKIVQITATEPHVFSAERAPIERAERRASNVSGFPKAIS